MLIEEMAIYADASGLGVYDPDGDTGTIYLGVLPDTPDDLISIFLRGGADRDPDNEYISALVQIIVRSRNKLQGMEKAQSTLGVFHGFHGNSFIDGGLHIVDCLANQGEPVDIGQDADDRYEWSLNFTIEYKREV